VDTGNTECRNWGGLGVNGHPRSSPT